MKKRYGHFNEMFGFTLIEILVALVIVSVGVLAIASFTVSTLGSGQVARERLTAVHLAEQLIEEWQKTNILPTLDTTYCKAPVPAWTVSTAATVAPCPTTGTVTTSSASCIPLFGVQVSYIITAEETPICGPSKAGSAFVFFNAAAPPNPMTQHIDISWSQKGKLHSVNLMHLSLVQ